MHFPLKRESRHTKSLFQGECLVLFNPPWRITGWFCVAKIVCIVVVSHKELHGNFLKSCLLIKILLSIKNNINHFA